MNESYDVVVVGGGIGGGAVSTVLARAGLRVLVLEKTAQHKDVVRGEWLAPWGVLEADRLGLTELYTQAGAHRVKTHISYADIVPQAESEAQALDLAAQAPTLPLCLGHPRTCNLLNDAALKQGAHLLRGIKGLKVTPGQPPSVAFEYEGQPYHLTPRWVIGADGRNGVVAKQIGCQLSHDEEHHLFSGMLVEEAHDWPEDLQVIATEGDVNVLAFPQGGGRVRIYLGWPKEDRTKLVGPQGPKKFLDAWQLDCVPQADAIVNATPVSPCIGYPNFDAWVDSPVREGVVLIGDAAGRNDPIIGQGLSITHRDVRLVTDAMLNDSHWRPEMFEAYVAERTERMRRLRITARLTTLRESVFGAEGRELRTQIHARLHKNPDLAAPYAAGFVGPESLPDEVWTDAFVEQIVGGPLWETAA